MGEVGTEGIAVPRYRMKSYSWDHQIHRPRIDQLRTFQARADISINLFLALHRAPNLLTIRNSMGYSSHSTIHSSPSVVLIVVPALHTSLTYQQHTNHQQPSFGLAT
jgi:hypothetical protein